MPKPEPVQLLPRVLSALLMGACLWLLLRSILGATNLPEFFADRQMAPYRDALASPDKSKAPTLFERDIKANSTNPDVYIGIAQACIKSNRLDLAAQYLERGAEACKSAPAAQRAAIYGAISDCYYRTEKTKPQRKAIEAAKAAVELAPESPEMLNMYGYLLVENGEQLDKAVGKIAYALELLKKQPDTPETRAMASTVEDSYGWALYKEHKYDAAVSALNQAIGDLPREGLDDEIKNKTFAVVYYHLGAACRAAKKPDLAKTALQTALSYAANLKETPPDIEGLKAEAAAAGATPATAGTTIGPAGTPAASPAGSPGSRPASATQGSSAAAPSPLSTAPTSTPTVKPPANSGPAATEGKPATNPKPVSTDGKSAVNSKPVATDGKPATASASAHGVEKRP